MSQTVAQVLSSAFEQASVKRRYEVARRCAAACQTGIVTLARADIVGLGMGGGMKLSSTWHHRYRFPAGLISQAVWLSYVFSLSLREVEPILAERGVVVSCGSARCWCRKFGQSFGDKSRLRRKAGRQAAWTRCLSASSGEQHCFWCAVDQGDIVLGILGAGRAA